MSKTHKTIYSVIMLIYRFAKVFGMGPYAIENNSFLVTSKMHRVGFFNLSIAVSMCIIMLCCFTNLVILRRDQQYFNQVNVITSVLSALRLLSAIVTVIRLFFTQEKFINACKRLNTFDKRKKQFQKPQYAKYYNAAIFLICLIFVLVIGVEAMYYFIMEEDFAVIMLDLFSNGLQFLIHLLSLLYFELYVLILANDFKFIKETTKKLNKAFKTPNQCQKETLQIVKTVSLMYDDLCKGSQFINSVFSFPLFSLISLNFMEVLLGIYLMQDQTTRNVKAIYWAAFYTVELFCILIPPGTAEGEAQQITKHLSEAELHANEELSNERNNFLLRTLHQSVHFNACGFFPISMSAIVGQFSISISFLLFMFQIIK